MLSRGDIDGAEALYHAAANQCPQAGDLHLRYARALRRAGSFQASLKAWEAVINADHNSVEGYLGAAEVLAALGRVSDAQAVLQPAVRLFANNRAVLEQQARLAQSLRDWDGAFAGWEQVRKRFPNSASGWIHGIATCRAADRRQDGERLFVEAISSFADEYALHVEWGLLPHLQQDWEECSRRFNEIMSRFPNIRDARVHLSDALARLQDRDAAERTLEQAKVELGSGIDLERAGARNAEIARRWDLALERWSKVSESDPISLDACLGNIRCLRQTAKFELARAAAEVAATAFPSSIEVEVQSALIANQLRDWPSALAKWASLKERYPDRGDVASGVIDALWQAQQDRLAQTDQATFDIPEILHRASPSTSEKA